MKMIIWDNFNRHWLVAHKVHWKEHVIEWRGTLKLNEATAMTLGEIVHFDVHAKDQYTFFQKPEKVPVF
jgi:hypothetical protein